MKNETGKLKVISKQFGRMGTQIDLQILLLDKKEFSKAENCLALAQAEITRLEKIFSRFDKNSELSRLNAQLGKFVEVSEQLKEVLIYSKQYHEKTSGYFDPRIIENLEAAGYKDDFSKVVKSESLQNFSISENKLEDDIIIEKEKIKLNKRLDLAGSAKGWIVDRIAELFLNNGYKDFVVDIGGDMYFSGRGPTGKAWYIDIESVDYQKMLLSLSGSAIATSGIGKRKWEIDGRRFHHLINPLEPENFFFDLKSVTVVAAKTLEADVWAKAIFLMGKEKGLEFANDNDIACAILDYRGNVFVSSGIRKYIF